MEKIDWFSLRPLWLVTSPRDDTRTLGSLDPVYGSIKESFKIWWSNQNPNVCDYSASNIDTRSCCDYPSHGGGLAAGMKDEGEEGKKFYSQNHNPIILWTQRTSTREQ